MDESDEFLSVTLYQSLLDAGWEKYNFGYSGPFPPYIRLGLTLNLDGLEPAFQSFIRDRIFLRTSRLMRDHLARFRYIRFLSEACEDAFGRNWAEATLFPVNQWLVLQPVRLNSYRAWDRTRSQMIEIPLVLFSVCSKIELS